MCSVVRHEWIDLNTYQSDVCSVVRHEWIKIQTHISAARNLLFKSPFSGRCSVHICFNPDTVISTNKAQCLMGSFT